MSFSPLTRGLDTAGGPLHVVHGSFTLDGANNPSVFGGAIVSVTRYVDGGATPFFRVKFDKRYPFSDKSSALVTGVKALAVATQAEHIDKISAPLVARQADEIDIVVTVAGVPADTAGIIVNIQLHCHI